MSTIMGTYRDSESPEQPPSGWSWLRRTATGVRVNDQEASERFRWAWRSRDDLEWKRVVREVRDDSNIGAMNAEIVQ